MDPNACLDRWVKAMIDGDGEEAMEAKRDLRGWLRCGGVEPDWSTVGKQLFFSDVREAKR